MSTTASDYIRTLCPHCLYKGKHPFHSLDGVKKMFQCPGCHKLFCSDIVIDLDREWRSEIKYTDSYRPPGVANGSSIECVTQEISESKDVTISVAEDIARSTSDDEKFDKMTACWPRFQEILAIETENGKYVANKRTVAIKSMTCEMKALKMMQDLLVRMYCQSRGCLVEHAKQKISQRMGYSIEEFHILQDQVENGSVENGSFATGIGEVFKKGFKRGSEEGFKEGAENCFKKGLIGTFVFVALTFVGTAAVFRCKHGELASDAQHQSNTAIHVTKGSQPGSSPQKSGPIKVDPLSSSSATVADLKARVQQWQVSQGKLSSLITVLQKDREVLAGTLDEMGVKSVGDATIDPRSKVLLEEFRDVLGQLALSQKKRDDYDMAVFKSESQLRRIERRTMGKEAGVSDADLTDLTKSMLSLEESLSSDSKETVPLALDDELVKELASVRKQKSQPK